MPKLSVSFLGAARFFVVIVRLDETLVIEMLSNVPSLVTVN